MKFILVFNNHYIYQCSDIIFNLSTAEYNIYDIDSDELEIESARESA